VRLYAYKGGMAVFGCGFVGLIVLVSVDLVLALSFQGATNLEWEEGRDRASRAFSDQVARQSGQVLRETKSVSLRMTTDS
jgi:hypothetical protein